MDKNQIKSRILEGINYAKEKLGFTLVHSSWGDKNKRCACALGCVLVHNDRHLDNDLVEDNEQEVARTLGVSTVWVESFVVGFDDDSISHLDVYDQKAFELGKELREELNPIENDQFVKSLSNQ